MLRTETYFLFFMLIIAGASLLAGVTIIWYYKTKEKAFERDLANIKSGKLNALDRNTELSLDSFRKIEELSAQVESKTEELRNLSLQIKKQSAEILESRNLFIIQRKLPYTKKIV